MGLSESLKVGCMELPLSLLKLKRYCSLRRIKKKAWSTMTMKLLPYLTDCLSFLKPYFILRLLLLIMSEAIKVVLRFRGGEGGGGEIGEDLEELTISDENIRLEERSFTYDSVLNSGIPQENMYEAVARNTVDSFLEGFNATIFAYG